MKKSWCCFYFILLISSPLRAELAGPDLGVLRPKGPPAISTEYKVLYFPTTAVPAQSAEVRQISQDLVVRVPLSESEKESWSVRGNLHNTQLSSGASVNGTRLPPQLWALAFGGSYQYRFEERKSLGADISAGSASDRLFYSYGELALTATITLTLPQGEKDSWLLLLNYSNVRALLNHIPIPGVAYLYNPSEEFRAVLGLPFVSLFWKPSPSWMLAGMGSPFSANAQIAYSIWGPLQAYANLSWTTQTFILVGRVDPDERFFHGQKTLALGLRSPLSRSLFLDLSTGYSFDREYYVGKSYRDVTGTPVEVDAGMQLTLQARARF